MSEQYIHDEGLQHMRDGLWKLLMDRRVGDYTIPDDFLITHANNSDIHDIPKAD